MVFEENIIFDDNLIQFAALLSSFSAAQLFNLFLFPPELICNLAICVSLLLHCYYARQQSLYMCVLSGHETTLLL